MKKRVLSGIRASGRLHIGNYLGAIKGMLALQDSKEYETFYMVADLHALTTPYDISELRTNRVEVVKDYLAAGLDPEKSVIFEQADSYHAELAFYLSSVVTVARMQHLPTFKEKVKQYPENASMALLNYPVLMASDILAYHASAVPVGDDQLPHLEVAREIARKMNEKYSTDFPEPEQFKTSGHYIPSLTGTGKMSKSVADSFILLSDTLEEIYAKVAKIPTDSGSGQSIPKDGGVHAIFALCEVFLGEKSRTELEEKYLSSGVKYSSIKKDLSEAIFNEIKPVQERRSQLSEEYVAKVIADGSEKSRAVVSETILNVRKNMGLI